MSDYLRHTTAGLLAAAWFGFCAYSLAPSFWPSSMSGTFLGLDPAGWTAIATFLLVIVAGLQVGVYVEMHRASAATQRGWVNLETLWLNFPTLQDSASALIGIRNSGGSPVFITRIKVRLLASASPLPDQPDYGYQESPDAPVVLVANEMTRWRHFFAADDLLASDIDDLVAGVKELWIFGVIEYTDTFRKPRNFGFVRRWDRFKSQSELRDLPNAGRRAHGGTFAHVGNRNYSYAD